MNGRCTVTWTLWLDLLLCSLPQKPIAHLWGPTTLCSHYIHLGSLNTTYLQFANITNWLLNLLFKGQEAFAENLALNKKNWGVSFKNVRTIINNNRHTIKQQHEFDQGMLKCFFGYWVLRFSFMPLCISVKVYFSCLNSELGNSSASKGSKNMTTTNNPEFLWNYLHHKSVQTKDSENMITTNNPEFLRAVIRLQLMFRFVSQ